MFLWDSAQVIIERWLQETACMGMDRSIISMLILRYFINLLEAFCVHRAGQKSIEDFIERHECGSRVFHRVLGYTTFCIIYHVDSKSALNAHERRFQKH